MNVDPSNAGQLQAWNGDGGDHWTVNAERFDRSVARYQRRFLDDAAIAPGAQVLDVGCAPAGRPATTRSTC